MRRQVSLLSLAVLGWSVILPAQFHVPRATPTVSVATIFSTTFDCVVWNISQHATKGINPSCNGSQIKAHQDIATSAGSYDEFTAAANNNSGAGGLGFRHYSNDGFDNNSGGVKTADLGNLTEIWVRMYVRFQLGFAWSGGEPGYTKDLHWFGNIVQSEHNFGYHTGEFDVEQESPPRQYLTTGSGWTIVQGGATGDGLFHCYEYHNLRGTGANGTMEIWVDDVQRASYTNGTQSSTAVWNYMVIGSNQNSPSNGGADVYRDFDDLAISTVGRIGCTYGHP